MTRGDKFLILVIALAVAVSFLLIQLPAQATGGEQVVITVENHEVIRVDLIHSGESVIIEVELDGGTAYVEMLEGRVRIIEMPGDLCPLHICSRTGWISKPGQVIVCMPNRLVVSITGGEREVDVWS